MTPHVVLVRRALEAATAEHGPGPDEPTAESNGFGSAWLTEIEGCDLTPAQINRVGRREGTVWLSSWRRATYEAGQWTVEPSATRWHCERCGRRMRQTVSAGPLGPVIQDWHARGDEVVRVAELDPDMCDRCEGEYVDEVDALEG